jgi:hypothetical protein
MLGRSEGRVLGPSDGESLGTLDCNMVEMVLGASLGVPE